MAELKPLGSEKLQGDEKLKRILELTYFNEKNKKSNTNKAELVKESTNGGVYGIVKEKDGYYVKRGLNESSLDYIGGMFMKNKNRFSSYAEASKRLNLLQGQEELNEATKYVLKQNKPQDVAPAPAPSTEAPMPAPSMDAAPSDTPPPSDEMGSLNEPSGEEQPSDTPPSDVPTSDMGGEEKDENGEPKRSDYMSEVQKYAGKLGQELRDLHDKMESDDIKYVLNMVISAVDLDKLDDDDIEEIGKKFEREEEETGDSLNNPSDDEEPSSENTPDEEMSEGDQAMEKLESFINSPVQNDEVDLSSYATSSKGNTAENERSVHDFGKHADLEMGNVDEEKEIDLEEMKHNISQAVSETLSKYFNQ
jgi:hypothetical protein